MNRIFTCIFTTQSSRLTNGLYMPAPSFAVFSRVLRDSTLRFVGPSVRRSVRPSVTLYFFWVFAVFGLTAPAQMMK